MNEENISIEERVKLLELKEHELRIKVSEHEGFIWRAGEEKYRDSIFCVCMIVITAANLLMLAVQIAWR